MPYLIIKAVDADAEIIEITAPTFSIGRLKDCECVLRHPGVSRLHAVVRLDGAKAFLHDKSSRNGTYVNNARVMNERELADGDVIQICDVYLTYRETKPSLETCAATDSEQSSNPSPVPSTVEYDKKAGNK